MNDMGRMPSSWSGGLFPFSAGSRFSTSVCTSHVRRGTRESLEPDLTPVRKRGARAENHAAVVLRLAHHTVEYDATVLHTEHLSCLLIDDPIDETSDTIHTATIRHHFYTERHPAIFAFHIDRFQNCAVVLDSHHLSNLEVERMRWGLDPRRNLPSMTWVD